MTIFVRIGAVLLLCAAASCATAPRPTKESLRIRGNPQAIVEGRVRDSQGRPVAGIGVRGIPRGKDIPWSAAAVTECDGSFRLSLPAPGDYGFQLYWNTISVITASPEDPARLNIYLTPGDHRAGVDLVFLGALWKPVMASAPGQTPSCP